MFPDFGITPLPYKFGFALGRVFRIKGVPRENNGKACRNRPTQKIRNVFAVWLIYTDYGQRFILLRASPPRGHQRHRRAAARTYHRHSFFVREREDTRYYPALRQTRVFYEIAGSFRAVAVRAEDRRGRYTRRDSRLAVGRADLYPVEKARRQTVRRPSASRKIGRAHV